MYVDRLTILNWEIKPPKSIENLPLGKDRDREDGIVIIDIGPSENSYAKYKTYNLERLF